MMLRTSVLFAAILVLVPALAGGSELPIPLCVVIDIDGAGWERVAGYRQLAGVEWWLELEGQLVACGQEELEQAAPRDLVLEMYRDVEPVRLRVARGLDAVTLDDLGATVIARGGRFALVLFEGPAPPALEAGPLPGAGRDQRQLLAVAPDVVLARQAANRPVARSKWLAGDHQALVDEVDPQRWFADVVSLASFNRYTFGPEIDLARDWLVQQLEALPGLVVTTPSFDVWGTTAYNVVATLPGYSLPDSWYIVGGHHDSTSEDPYTAAPGAEDNASGCAGVLELARVFTAHPPEATMLFICYSGEEQGLHGSTDHADGLVASGDASKVQAVLNMDMVGYTSDADLDCLLESESFAQSLIDAFEAAATQFTTLRIVTSTFAWGSDHVPYLNLGIPALLTIENDWDIYPDYHRTTDLPANLSLEMGGEILRMNVAAVAELVGWDPGLLFADGFESGGTSRWNGPTGIRRPVERRPSQRAAAPGM